MSATNSKQRICLICGTHYHIILPNDHPTCGKYACMKAYARRYRERNREKKETKDAKVN